MHVEKYKKKKKKCDIRSPFFSFSLQNIDQMQIYFRLTSLVSRSTLLKLKPTISSFCQFGSLTKATTESTKQLSNRQKFKQLQPSPRLYEKLENLGFGALLRTKRYAAVYKQKERKKQEKGDSVPETKYSVKYKRIYACRYGLINIYVASSIIVFCWSKGSFIYSSRVS